MMIRFPLNKTPFWALSSSRYGQYCLIAVGTRSFSSGHPFRIFVLNVCSDSSVVVCSLMACKLLSDMLTESAKFMLSRSSNTLVSCYILKISCCGVTAVICMFGKAALDRKSAMCRSLPFLQMTSMLYFCSLNNICCSLFGVDSSGFLKMASSGL